MGCRCRTLDCRQSTPPAGEMAAGGAFIDLKTAFSEAALREAGYRVWRL
jgi:hypothetical protein